MPGINWDRILSWGLLLASLALLGPYFNIHRLVINEPLPLTIREAAPVMQTAALLDPAQPRMYSTASLPEQTNVYGPLYPLVAMPAVRFLPFPAYTTHRLLCAAFLGLGCLLLGIAVAKKSHPAVGLAAAVLFYAANVATPSPAAGPDTLATLLYISSILIIHHYGTRNTALCGALALGGLAFLTKPYASLAIPALCAYLFLFRSWRKSLAITGLAGAATCLAALAINQIWPCYFFSVLQMHFHSATRVFTDFKTQLIEFGYLNFAPIILVAWLFPWKRMIPAFKPERTSAASSADLSWDGWMIVMALLVLAAALGWHGGAYMIYYNHLLLPPLLLAAFSRIQPGTRHARLALPLIVLNMGMLLILKPPTPVPYAGPLQFHPTDKVLIEPALQPLANHNPNVEVIDNGQAEYAVKEAYRASDPEIHKQTTRWEADMTRKIESRYYDYILLSSRGAYDRAVFYTKTDVTKPLFDHYELTGTMKIAPYYLAFKDRTQFGRLTTTLLILKARAK